MSASDCNEKCKEFVWANNEGHTPTHWYASLEDQVRGNQPCLLHKGSHACDPCPYGADFALVGSPCHPFSTQRADRFEPGTVEAHAECRVAMSEMVSFIQKYEPRVVVLEQVRGFLMPVSKGAGDDTPKARRGWKWNGRANHFEYNCYYT